MMSVGYPSRSSSLYHLERVFLFGDVRVPDSRSIFYRCGRTSVLNSFSFVELDRVLIFLLTNASCWFALALMMYMCFPPVRSFVRVTPRYFVLSVDFRFVPCRV